MNAFFKSQFSYSPLTWMMHSRKLNNKINRLHERCLRVTYNDVLSSFEELLERDNSVSVHNRNIQCLAIELYKAFNGIWRILWNYEGYLPFISSNYDIRNRRTFTTRSVKTVYHGTESLLYLAPKVWEPIPNNLRTFQNSRRMCDLVGFADSTFHKSALYCRCSFNFHFYIY